LFVEIGVCHIATGISRVHQRNELLPEEPLTCQGLEPYKNIKSRRAHMNRTWTELL
jgi:hypothetical protein